MNDRTIREAAEAGARCADEVGRACGAGTQCGGCRPAVERILGVSKNEGGAERTLIRAPKS